MGGKNAFVVYKKEKEKNVDEFYQYGYLIFLTVRIGHNLREIKSCVVV